MTEFQAKIIQALLKKYENSRQSRDGGVVQRPIKLTRKQSPLDLYLAPDAIQHRDQYDRDIKTLEGMGLILVTEKDGQVTAVTLDLGEVDQLYGLCHEKNPKDVCAEAQAVLASFSGEGFVSSYMSYVKEYMDTHFRIPKSYFTEASELQDQLVCLNGMQRQQTEIMERDFSVAYLGDSKRFSSFSSGLCRIIRDFDSDCPYEEQGDILEYFNIVRNTTYALVRNKLRFRLGMQKIDLGKLGYEFSFSDAMIRNLVLLESDFRRVVTIENLTTWRMYQDPDAVLIYLAGFNDRTKQSLLKKIHECFPDKEYLHYSDIDSGGFLIWHHLVQSTGIAFKPLHMGIDELEKKSAYTHALTDGDRARLQRLLHKSEFSVFHLLISYMLEHNVKLEQESLD